MLGHAPCVDPPAPVWPNASGAIPNRDGFGLISKPIPNRNCRPESASLPTDRSSRAISIVSGRSNRTPSNWPPFTNIAYKRLIAYALATPPPPGNSIFAKCGDSESSTGVMPYTCDKRGSMAEPGNNAV